MVLALFRDSKWKSGKIVKILIYDKAQVIRGTNYDPPCATLGSEAYKYIYKNTM